jgi:hypothetical protein
LIDLNRGLARLDFPDFELASRTDVDALGAFLEEHGMTVVDPPGQYDGRSYDVIYFTDLDGMKLEAMVYNAAEATPGGKEEIAEAYREGRLTGASDLSPIHGKA